MTASQQKDPGNDWFQAQQQYWDTWFDAQRKFFGAETSGPANLRGNWESFFKEWQTAAQSTGQPNADAYRQMFAQAGQSYLEMLEKFYAAAGAAPQPEEAVKSWTDGMQRFFAGLMQNNAQPHDPQAQFRAFTESMAHAGPAFWTNIFKMPAPGETQPHNAASFLFDPFGFYASMPGIGYTREKQDHLNLLYRLWVDYEGQMRRYNIEMTKVGLQALHRFQDYVAKPPEGAKPLHSLKDIYVKWVDVAEEVYADYALSGDYTKMYGDVVNALMALKKQIHVLTDDAAEQMNLPTRAEIDSLHKKVQEMKRENAQLKKDVAALKRAAGLDTPKPAAKKAAAVKKKPAAKKSSAKKKR